MKIKQDILDVLIQSTTDENILYLPATQLERKLYTDVNKCLESIGGSWNRKLKGHLFESDPSDLLDDMINTGEFIDKKKEYQFFETPVELAKRLIYLAEIEPRDILLEPSAGKGRILNLFPKENPSCAIELEKDNFWNLQQYKALNATNTVLVQGDFLEISLNTFRNIYFTNITKIVMNPPFNKGQDVKHILHAFECLNSGGRLVSIVSESPFFRMNSANVEFRNWLKFNNAEVIDLDAGEFKESGTNVKTRIIIVDKI